LAKAAYIPPFLFRWLKPNGNQSFFGIKITFVFKNLLSLNGITTLTGLFGVVIFFTTILHLYGFNIT